MSFFRVFKIVKVLALAGALSSVARAQRAPVNATHTVGAESCRDCHTAIVETWERSRHATSFSTLANSVAARQMAKVIGMKPENITTNASCVRCHFTQEKLAGAVQTTAAVSCESCHGGAEKWIDVHNSKSLSRTERISQSCAAGMKHPGTIFATANSCYECHVVDDEQLVNKAGHPAMSNGFELYAWYKGEVKHNFLVSKEGKPVKSNSQDAQPIPIERKRMLFLTGKLLNLSHSLNAVASSLDAPVDAAGKLVRLPNGKPTYGVQHAQTVQRMIKEITALQAKVNIPEYAQVLGLTATLPLSTGHSKELGTAAAEIQRLAEQFTKRNEGAKYAAVDGELEKSEPSAVGKR